MKQTFNSPEASNKKAYLAQFYFRTLYKSNQLYKLIYYLKQEKQKSK